MGCGVINKKRWDEKVKVYARRDMRSERGILKSKTGKPSWFISRREYRKLQGETRRKYKLIEIDDNYNFKEVFEK